MNTVRQLGAPLYEVGYRLPAVRPRYSHTVRRPQYPIYDGWGLHGLGQQPVQGPQGPTILKSSAPVIGTLSTEAIATLFPSTVGEGGGAAGGFAAGGIAGPIGAGIGILVAVLAGLWAAHNARVAGATHENQAINSAVSAWDQGMKSIFAAANSSDPAQNVSGSQAAEQVQQLWSQFWAQMSPYLHAPGVADSSGGGINCGSTTLNPAGACTGTPGGHKCDSSCTATCCVGCQDLYPSMLEAISVLNSPSGGTVQVCAVARSSYGAAGRSGYSLTFTPPVVAGAGASIGTDLTSGLSTLFGSAPGTSGSLLPVLAIGALAFFLLR